MKFKELRARFSSGKSPASSAPERRSRNDNTLDHPLDNRLALYGFRALTGTGSEWNPPFLLRALQAENRATKVICVEPFGYLAN
jgi:hypothetical protein